MSRLALDSNILVYFTGVVRHEDDECKVAQVYQIIEKLKDRATLLAPVQALGELFVVLKRSGIGADEARDIVIELADAFEGPPSQRQTLLGALDLAAEHKLQFWDALILTAAAEVNCSMLLSEDMQHGFVAHGVTVINPFAEKTHPKLQAVLGSN